MPQFSRSRLQLWFDAGHVLVDGKPARGKDTAYGDETVVIQPQSAPEDAAYTPEEIALNIVYEDEHIMVINKPAGLVVHPGAGNWSGTLLNGLLFHAPQLAGVPRAGIVHRLDKDTSGLMVVGKTLAAQTDLVRQLAGAHRQARILRAGVGHAARQRHHRRLDGAPSEGPRQDGGVEQFFGQAGDHALPAHRPAACSTAVRSAWCSASSKPAAPTRSACTCSHLGFALVGDSVYGKQHLAPVFPRQALQARRLGLVHPATGEDVEWIVPLADDFAELIERAGIPEPELVTWVPD